MLPLLRPGGDWDDARDSGWGFEYLMVVGLSSVARTGDAKNVVRWEDEIYQKQELTSCQ
jgi:hypothetical protein